jgi:hypothetical protein
MYFSANAQILGVKPFNHAESHPVLKLKVNAALWVGAIFILTWLGFMIYEFTESGENYISERIEGPYIFLQGQESKSYTIKYDGRQMNTEEIALAGYSEKLKCYPNHSPGPFQFEIMKEHSVPSWRYEGGAPILAVSDLDGDFRGFVEVLLSNKVIDKSYHWTFGNGHLVVLGDLFDRGVAVTECLWLIYKLEQEATEFGGTVHFLLGNHEIMVLSGDYRYTKSKYQRVADELGMEQEDLFSEKTVLGDWLRTKNTIEIIGDILFVHAGISLEMVENGVSIPGMNEIVRKRLGEDYKIIMAKPGMDKLIYGRTGPLWYRGYFNEEIESETLAQILTFYNAKKIVVGHTLVPTIQGMFEDQLYAIDVAREPKHPVEALYINQGEFLITKRGVKQPVTKS